MLERVAQVEGLFEDATFTTLVATHRDALHALHEDGLTLYDAQTFAHIARHDVDVADAQRYIAENPTHDYHPGDTKLTPYKDLSHSQREDLESSWGMDSEVADGNLMDAEREDNKSGRELTDFDLQEFMDDASIPYYRRYKNAETRQSQANEALRQHVVEAGVDGFVLWSVMKVCDDKFRSLSDMATMARYSMGRINALDQRLRSSEGGILTYIDYLGLISAGINDGLGLTIREGDELTLNRQPTYGVPSFDSSGRSKMIYSVAQQSGVRLRDVAEDKLPVGEWTNLYDIKGWKGDSGLFFGEPVDGTLNVWRVPNADARTYYAEVINRARMMAELALGTLTLNDVVAKGFNLYTK